LRSPGAAAGPLKSFFSIRFRSGARQIVQRWVIALSSQTAAPATENLATESSFAGATGSGGDRADPRRALVARQLGE
jgi:hypothetical protein